MNERRSRATGALELIDFSMGKVAAAHQPLHRLPILRRRLRNDFIGQLGRRCGLAPGPAIDLRLLQPVAQKLLVEAGWVLPS